MVSVTRVLELKDTSPLGRTGREVKEALASTW